MSLSKQLSLCFLIVLSLVFTGISWVNVLNTRDFVASQLQSHAQDTATSLGLSIQPYLGESGEPAIVETMVNAIFDSGFYQHIELRNAEGKVLLEKNNPTQVDNVPKWFIAWFPLDTPSASTELSTGWTQAGQLSVTSHPGFGYTQLWDNAKGSLSIIVAIFLFTLGLVWLLVRMITQPLMAVVTQADAISNRHFDQVHPVPKTPELRVFVNAINTMSHKLGVLFEQLTLQSNQYREHAYTDSLTHLGNRRAFDLNLNQWLRDAEYQPEGFICIVRLSSLNEVNNKFGRLSGDNYIKSVAHELCKHVDTFKLQTNIYRLSGADFAIAMEGWQHSQVENLLEKLEPALRALEKSEYEHGVAHMGVSHFSYGDDYATIMESADTALGMAVSERPAYRFADGLAVSHSHQGWREAIKQILAANTVYFAEQGIVSAENNTAYVEWFARMPDINGEQSVPIGQLIPASARLDYAQDLDKMIIALALDRLQHYDGRVGLNLSRQSLLDPSFHSWFTFQLPKNSPVCERLVLEIPERAVVNDSGQLMHFVRELKKRGVQITIERFGAQLASITHLRDLQPNYLKIDGRFIHDINTNKDNQLFVRSLIGIAKGLGIAVIAEMVENAQESAWLEQAGVNYQQGYFITPPKSVD